MEKTRIEREGLDDRFISVVSELEKNGGEKEDLRIELGKDGLPKAVAFFDIDGTLAELKFIHAAVIKEMFPDAEPEELAQTFFAGFKLGTGCKEFDRMLGIYVKGRDTWKDPKVYLQERKAELGKDIDEVENADHDLAMKYAGNYSSVAAKITRETYDKEPEKFEQAKIKPIFKLADLYKRLGIPMVGVTANGSEFTKEVAKCLDLSSLFIDIATDETMQGGGKEVAIEALIKELQDKGLQIPLDKLVIVGDSIKGDIGSVSKLKEKNSAIKAQGILVLENEEALQNLQDQIQQDPSLQEIVSNVDTNALVIEDVPLNKNGRPMLGSKHRENFLTKL